MDNFKAYLQEQMDLKRPCTITFRSVEGGVSTFKAHIIDMSTVAGRDMLETDAGFHIGLNQIVKVNDRVQENYC